MTSLLARYVRKLPAQKRSRDRLDLILDTAARLLSEVGAERLTMAQIADESGLVPSSVYDYVVDSSDLVAAVAARGLERLRSRLGELMTEPTTADEARNLLLGAFRTALGHFETEPGFSEAIAAVRADPSRAHVDLDDSVANARLLSSLVAPFAKEKDLAALEARAVLLTHLTGAVAIMVGGMSSDDAQRIVASYEALIGELIVDS